MLPHPSGCLVGQEAAGPGAAQWGGCSSQQVTLALDTVRFAPTRGIGSEQGRRMSGHGTHPTWNLLQEPDLSRAWVPGALTGVPSLGDTTAQVSHALHVLHSLNPQLSCSWLVTDYCHPGGFARSYSWHSTLTLPWEQMKVQPWSDVSIGEKVL